MIIGELTLERFVYQLISFDILLSIYNKICSLSPLNICCKNINIFFPLNQSHFEDVICLNVLNAILIGNMISVIA